ncbi:MAG: biotin--[acetyl-CoA-carboxylase] ligase [Bacteroidota bacterium]|nr:biotin--[acetyl-CoA-carboxylase] ligase [Bacteroidota bacterium]
MSTEIGHNILRFTTLESTNKYVLGSLEKENFAAGTVVLAGFQEAGKGLGKNHWESEAGKNLLLSIILKPAFLEPQYQFYLNKFASLGVYDFIRSLLPDKKVTVKWPNDVYIDDGKVAGILINNTLIGKHFEYAVAGIGINLNQKAFRSDAPNPVSINHYTKRDLDLEKSLHDLLECLNKRFKQLEQGREEYLDRDYLAALYRHRQWSEFISAKERFKGMITGISEFGQLRIEHHKGTLLEFDFKEVEFII